MEIYEAEKALHEGFGKLQTGLRQYLRYLTAAKSVEDEVRAKDFLKGRSATTKYNTYPPARARVRTLPISKSLNS